jgi:Flp pilus assembly protein TadD
MPRVKVHRRRGNVLVRLGRREAAQEALQRAVLLDPDDADAWSDLGVALQTQRRLSDAATALVRATELDPDAVDTWLNLAAIDAADGSFMATEVARR